MVSVYEMTSPYIRDYKSAKREILNIQEDLEKKHAKVEGLMDSVEKLEFEARKLKQDAGRDAGKFDLERRVLLNQKDVLEKEVLLMQSQLASLSKDRDITFQETGFLYRRSMVDNRSYFREFLNIIGDDAY